MKVSTALLLVILGVLAVGGGWYFGTSTQVPTDSSIASGQLAFPDLAANLSRATTITILHQGKTLVLDRNGDSWGVKEDGDYKVQAGKVHALLTALTELRLTEPRTTDPTQFATLGVEDPQPPTANSNLLSVLDADSHPIAELIVGHRRVRTEGDVPDEIYVRRPGQNQSWLAEGRLEIDADPQLWLDRDIVNIDHSKIASVVIVRGDAPIELRTEADKMVMKAPADHPNLDQEKLDDVGRGLEFLTFTAVRPIDRMPGKPLGEATFTTTDGVAINVAVNQADKEIWARLSATGDGAAHDAAAADTRKWAGWAFQIGDWKTRSLVPTMDDLKALPAAVPAAPASQ
jgi:hypothetical protein